jgi:predicted O-methyltransferase YrrM
LLPFAAEYARRLAGPRTDILDQLPLLHERACRYPGVRVAEFGVRTGESTSAFLAAAEQAGGHVWSFDINPPRVPPWWHDSGLWTFTRTSSLNPALGPPECDVLFLDTSHAYDDTVAELGRLVPAVRPGGLVLCHDTRLTDPPFEPYAVARALDAWCEQAGRSWAELGGRYGLAEIAL